MFGGRGGGVKNNKKALELFFTLTQHHVKAIIKTFANVFLKQRSRAVTFLLAHQMQQFETKRIKGSLKKPKFYPLI